MEVKQNRVHYIQFRKQTLPEKITELAAEFFLSTSLISGQGRRIGGMFPPLESWGDVPPPLESITIQGDEKNSFAPSGIIPPLLENLTLCLCNCGSPPQLYD